MSYQCYANDDFNSTSINSLLHPTDSERGNLNCITGLDVVTSIASIPTYKPAARIRQYNDLAQFLGDERAKIARAIWNRPLKTLYISDCGEVKVAKPTLAPTLP